MSGSLTSIYDSVSYALNIHSKAIAMLQEQSSTGNRVNRGSDSPSEAYRILGLSTQDHTLDTYKENINELIGTLEISSTIIEDTSSELADIRTLLTQIVGGIQDSEGQRRIAEKINSALEQVVSFANTKHANQYLFGGNDSGQAPYIVTRENGQITAVTYRGAGEARRIDVAPSVSLEGSHVGDDVFRSDNRQVPVFSGTTGVKAGTGTSNVQGDIWLTVEHDGANYRVSIDDGASFVTVPAGGATNQAITDSRTGRVLYVDTTEISATGQELVRVPGTYDLFNTLINIRDMLLNERGLSSKDLADTISRAVAGVEEVQNSLTQADVTTGSKVGFLNNLKDNLEDMQFDTQDEVTRLQEADIAQIAIDLSRREVLYQMSLSVVGKLMSTTLLDFIS